ncbi:MAG: glycosyltransferase family 4 protein [Gemmatimonadaceae bacterium]|nr:glycosyltransferase family 4 protein [Gemmatimonadaceae bacterium]
MTATDASTPHSRQSKPRVLFVNTRSALGADVSVHLTLIQNLDPDRVDVFVATNRHSSDLDATVHAIRAAPRAQLMVCDLGQEIQGRSRIGRAVSALRNIPAFLTLLRLALLVRREGISVLHTTDRPRDAAFTTLLSKLTGAALVLHVHVKWTPEIGRAAQWASRQARAVIGISEFTCQSLIAGGVAPDRVARVYNATDATRFNPDSVPSGTMRSALGLDRRVPVVGIVGRFMIWKGHHELVTAFRDVRAELPDARLVIIGRASPKDAEYVETVERLISDLGLDASVDWVPWMNDVRAGMADLDILAMPSFEEPFGLVVTESMALGRPVVGYASGALPELVTDELDGLLVPARDTAALANALVSLLRDPDRRMAMGQRARQRVMDDFSPVRQAAAVTSLYLAISRGEAVPRT